MLVPLLFLMLFDVSMVLETRQQGVAAMLMKSPRKFRNFLIQPRFQLKFIFYLVTLMLAMVGSMVAITLYKLNELRLLIESEATITINVIQKVNEMVLDTTQLTLIVFGLFVFLSFVYGIIISHRIAGPMIAILYQIREMKSGNYEAGRHLRKYDELQPIMEELHGLAGELKSKRKSDSTGS